MISRKRNWQLQEAKNRLSEVVRLAQSEGPQTITVRGAEAVVVVSVEDYRRDHPEHTPSSSALALLDLSQQWADKIGDIDLDLDQEYGELRRVELPGKDDL